MKVTKKYFQKKNNFSAKIDVTAIINQSMKIISTILLMTNITTRKNEKELPLTPGVEVI